MKRAVPVLSGVCAALCIVLCLMYPESVLSSARDGFSLFVKSVLPALFPSFVLASVLAGSGLLTMLGRLFSPAMKWFNLPGEAGPLIFLGAVSGYPVGAKLTAQLYERGEISLPAAERLCAVCNLASPMFLSGTLAAAVLHSARLGIVLIASHWIGALAVLAAGVFTKKTAAKTASLPVQENRDFSLTKSLLGSVSDGMSAMLRVCGAIMLFSVLVAALRVSGILGIFSGAVSQLGVDRALAEAMAAGFFEKTTGCAAVASLSIGLPAKAALCSFLDAFGGCSILLQTLFFLPVRPSRYWGYKLIQGGVAALTALLLAGL